MKLDTLHAGTVIGRDHPAVVLWHIRRETRPAILRWQRRTRRRAALRRAADHAGLALLYALGVSGVVLGVGFVVGFGVTLWSLIHVVAR